MGVDAEDGPAAGLQLLKGIVLRDVPVSGTPDPTTPPPWEGLGGLLGKPVRFQATFPFRSDMPASAWIPKTYGFKTKCRACCLLLKSEDRL